MNGAALRWRATYELFQELSDLAPAERETRLTRIGATDPNLKSEVEALIAADESVDARLARFDAGILDVLHRNLTVPRPLTSDPLRLVGRTLSHFRIIEPIAAGGMGIVYRAQDTRLQREVALKLPLAPLQLDSHARARFLREADTAGSLDHPNLCVIHEVGESDDGQPFLAMALYTGETLKERIARDSALPIADALDLAAQMADGLAFAHDAGVVHRDLKPGNVMLLPDGSVRILDFGLARFTDLDPTASSAGLGTAGYMAPEQIRGHPVDARADLWSLGVLLYEMLTGVRPFTGADPVSIAHAIVHHEPARPSRLRPGVTPALDELIAALLQKEPAHRYVSAHAVVRDLAAVRGGANPVFRRPLAQRSSAWLLSRTPPVRAAFVVVALATVLSAGFSTRWFLQRSPTGNEEAYRYYLRGLDYENSGPSTAAGVLYERALALDPDFALARAHLALVHLTYGPRPVPVQLERARAEATAALRVQPSLPEAHLAMGLYWQRRNDHERALTAFARARRGLRKNAVLAAAMGTSYRSLGRWEDAVTAFENALRLDPQNVNHAPALALTYGRMRRYEESQRAWGRYIAMTPDAYTAMLIKGHAAVRWQGTADSLAAALQRIPPDWDENGMTTFSRVTLARLQRRPEDALRALDSSRHEVSEDDMLYRPHSLLRGMAYAELGDARQARTQFDSAIAMLQDSIAQHPSDARLHIALGMAFAGAERRDDAIRAARQAMTLAPLSVNVVSGTCVMGGAAEIFASLGENDAALDLIERLLLMPAGREASVPLLRVDPSFDRLRADPRFSRLLARHSPRQQP